MAEHWGGDCVPSLFTREPGKVSGDIHDRQPAILPAADWSMWVTGTPADAAAILHGALEAALSYYPVTLAMGKPSTQGLEAVAPIEPHS